MDLEDLLEERLKYYPYGNDDEVVKVEQTSSFCLRTYYSNGWSDLYNARTKTISFIRPVEDYPDLTRTEDQWRHEFAWRLNHQLMAHHVTQSQLSELTGISRIMISRYSNEKAMPSAMSVALMAKAIGCSLDALIGF